MALEAFVRVGRKLFSTSFNIVDGAGRPQATGDSKPTIRIGEHPPPFHRLAGPDANSCLGCHNQPASGGAGDFATNAFVGAHFTDPPTRSIAPEITNERNTISIFGAGAIETVAREMTESLHDQRDSARLQAASTGESVRVSLVAKGVDFGSIVVSPNGTYDPSEVEGIDMDLVVKPFGAKGIAVSLREFSVFALNQHHGIQAAERFGWTRTGVTDFDGDGVDQEFTQGQVSALTVYQATLPPPRWTRPRDAAERAAIDLGLRRFDEVGCTSCHVPALRMRSAFFLEPNPYNRPGAAIPSDVGGQIVVPLAAHAGTGVFQGEDGLVYVAAYTDLKRHVICDEHDPFYCNEKVIQDFVPTDQFLTAKLWDAGTSAGYGHRGDLTTLSEAIIHHSGDARSVRERFQRLPNNEKISIIRFLRSLRVVEDPPLGKKGDSHE